MEMRGGELYHDRMIEMLQAVWGEGFLSPGGPEEVTQLVADADFSGLSILDIGCGAGGIDVALARTHGAGYVTGIDVEDTVLKYARALIDRAGLGARIGLVKVVPGPLPFPPGTFDVVFSKDSIVHITDKHALMREIYRVLRPGGRFIASDWLISHDGPPSLQMAAYVAAEGLDFVYQCSKAKSVQQFLFDVNEERTRFIKDNVRAADIVLVMDPGLVAWESGSTAVELPIDLQTAMTIHDRYVPFNTMILDAQRPRSDLFGHSADWYRVAGGQQAYPNFYAEKSTTLSTGQVVVLLRERRPQ